MVRESKLPEITLHLDNKKETLSEIALALNGSINIFPTALGGQFPVTNLKYGLELIDYVYFDQGKLDIGTIDISRGDLTYTTDSSQYVVENIHLNAHNAVNIGSDSVKIFGQTIEITASDGETTLSSSVINIQSTELEINSDNKVTIGGDSFGTKITEHVEIFGKKEINIACENNDSNIISTITLEAPELSIKGMVTFNNNWSVEGAAIFQDLLEIRKGTLLNIMDNSNNGQTHGLWFDGSGEYSIYACDSSGLAPNGTQISEMAGIPTAILGTDTGLRFRTKSTGNGFIFEDSSGTEIMKVNTDGDMHILRNFDCSGDVSVSNDLTISGNLESDSVRIDTGGNIDCSGSIIFGAYLKLQNESFAIDQSGNLNSNGDAIVSNTIYSNGEMNITDLFAKKIIVQNEANEEAIILDGEEKSIRTEGDIYANIYEGNQIRVGTGTSDNTDISGNTITTGHITCESISMNLLESIDKQISIGDSSIYVSGTISAASHIDISGDCVVQNEIVSSSFHTADDKCVISDGNIEVAGTCTCDELHASFFEIHENLVMDCSRGRITGRSIEVSGQINATAITTDNVTINEAGIQCNGIITANKFVIEGTNTGELITIDSGGNVQLSDGNVYINGDVRTNNGTMSVNGNLTVVDTTRTEKIYIENEEIVLGKQLHPRGTEPEEPEKSSIIIKDESGSYFYASKDSLEIGNMTNEIIITSDSIRLTESGGSQIKIDIDAAHVPKLELTDNVGNKTSVSSTRIETETIQVNSVQTDYLTLGETVYNEEVSAAYRDSIQINLANELTLAIIEKYGPEYSLLLNIYHEDPNTLNKYAISVCFKLNIGSFFVGTVVGLLGDLYFNGPDRLIFKHYDATIWGGAENLNKIKYERTGSTIVIYLYELSDIPISYDYTFAKSVGLSFG